MNKAPTIVFEPPTFVDYEQPKGYLVHDPACHALWYYYVVASNNHAEHILNPIVLEGDADQEVNFKQLFTSIALSYGVEPERMLKFWKNVDAQCLRLDVGQLPEKYRFSDVPEIRTQ